MYTLQKLEHTEHERIEYFTNAANLCIASVRPLSMLSMSATNFTINFCKIQMLVSQFRDKILKIWLATFFGFMWEIYAQNFNSLASKLREEFEVSDTHGWTDDNFFLPDPLSVCGKFKPYQFLNPLANHKKWVDELVG